MQAPSLLQSPDALPPAEAPVAPSAPRFPGPISAALLDELDRYVRAEPKPFVLDLKRGHGMFLVTVEGQELFDWAGYFGSKLIAHNHPRLYEPEYADRYLLQPKKSAIPTSSRRGASRIIVYYANAVNSGAEAVENSRSRCSVPAAHVSTRTR